MRRWRSRGSLPTPATGRDPVLRQFCHDNQVSYVLAVPVDLPLLDVYGKPLRPDVVLADTPNTGWQRRSAGDGSKGKRFYDWAAHTVTVKDQPAAEGHEHTLLIRRARTPKVTTKHPDGTYEVEYFLVHARTGTRIPAMIGAAGLRWNIEDDNKAGKDLLGLDQYQVRNWTPWHRHVSICMLAAILGLLAAAILARDALDHTAAITQDLWRRAHQTRALISHYRRRGDPLPQDLRM